MAMASGPWMEYASRCLSKGLLDLSSGGTGKGLSSICAVTVACLPDSATLGAAYGYWDVICSSMLQLAERFAGLGVLAISSTTLYSLWEASDFTNEAPTISGPACSGKLLSGACCHRDRPLGGNG